jgi:hypothetical protein
MKPGKLFSSLTTVLLLLIGCAGTSDEVLTGSRSACILYADGKTPAAGALVKIFKSDAVNGEYVSLQTTDNNGRYSIENIPSGSYNIWAEKDSLVTFRNGIIISPDQSDISPDTLKCPSTVSGIIGVEPQDDPLTVTIQVLGLDKFFNNTDKNAHFTMKGMAAGNYTLLLKSTKSHYTPTTVEITIGKCSQDTLPDTLRLTYTGIPVVQGLNVSYDTSGGIVHLGWNNVDYRSFQEYVIYRDFFDSAVYSINPIAATEDTVFQDTVFKRQTTKGPFSGTDTNDYHFRYRVAIRSNVNEIGQTLGYTDIKAVSPLKVVTRIFLSIVHSGKGYITEGIIGEKRFINLQTSGAASINDSLNIRVHAENRIRTLSSILWIDSTTTVLRTRTAENAGMQLTDTLSCFWTTTGMKQLILCVTDCTGAKTSDTIRIAVVGDPPSVNIFSKDSIHTSTGGDKTQEKLHYSLGDTLHLHAGVIDKFGIIENVDWKFGSSVAGTANAVQLDTFVTLPDTAISKYPVVVSVTDDDGNSTSDSLNVKISLFAPVSFNASFSPRMYQAGTVFKEHMWLYGGVGTTPEFPKTSFKSFDEVWSSPDGSNWTKVKSNIPSRCGQAMTAFGDKLWLIGGYASSWGEYRNDIWNSTDGIAWNCVTDSAPFTPRIFHSVAVFANKLWVIGGTTRKAKVNDVWSSADGVNWNLATDSAPFSPRNCHASTVFDSKIWIIGGEDSTYNPLNDIWSSTDGAQWSLVTKNADFSPRQGHSLLVYNNRIWLLEGYGMNAFDLASDIWSSVDGRTWVSTGDDESITPRAFHSSMVFRNRIWVVAGMSGYNSCANDVWRSGVLENK